MAKLMNKETMNQNNIRTILVIVWAEHIIIISINVRFILVYINSTFS